ncbi:MAG: MBL fold metallo-hydrolase, partial [Acidimicrobiales bacterium]
MPELSAVLLGTGNPLPDAQRAGAATLIRAGEKRFLVDAGRGVCMRLVAAGTLPVMLSGVLLTHLHSDHVCDLNDVITTHWIMSQQPSELEIIGPEGTADVVDGALKMLHSDIAYRRAHHRDLTWSPQIKVRHVAGSEVTEIADVVIRTAYTDHRPVEPSVGYRFEYS